MVCRTGVSYIVPLTLADAVRDGNEESRSAVGGVPGGGRGRARFRGRPGHGGHQRQGRRARAQDHPPRRCVSNRRSPRRPPATWTTSIGCRRSSRRCSTSGPGSSPVRRPGFTREQIAAAVVRIADAEGSDALSMRRIAAELDAGTMTLYHYAAHQGRAALVGHRRGDGGGAAPDEDLPDNWRAAVTVIANRSRAGARAPPWMFDITDDPAIGPNSVRHFDQTLQAVSSLPIDLEGNELVAAIDEYVFGYCLHQRNNVDAGSDTDEGMVDYVLGLLGTASTGPDGTVHRRGPGRGVDPDRALHAGPGQLRSQPRPPAGRVRGALPDRSPPLSSAAGTEAFHADVAGRHAQLDAEPAGRVGEPGRAAHIDGGGGRQPGGEVLGRNRPTGRTNRPVPPG